MSDETKEHAEKLTGLALLREPFDEKHISKLPKPTKYQTKDVKDNPKLGIWCKECGGWHHPKVVHLDYVGHAALTHRLLDCDPEWSWEPMSVDENGLPAWDRQNGLWIKLTVCGVSRYGYGNADGKTGGNAVKEAIGDALRNAAMRFGAALDLWHKGDLHDDTEEASEQPEQSAKSASQPAQASKANSRELFSELQMQLRAHQGETDLKNWAIKNKDRIALLPTDWQDQIREEYKGELMALVAEREASNEGERLEQFAREGV